MWLGNQVKGELVSMDSNGSGAAPHKEGQLRPNAIGLWGVLFFVVAFSAPITAMTANSPIAVGYGNGIYAPAGFIFACIVLTIFSIGFVAMAKHITSAGAFYTFVSRGIGKPIGFGAGWLSTAAYISIEAALIGVLSVFTDTLMVTQFNITLPWVVYAVIAILLIGFLSYRDISVAARVLGVVLIIEIALLSIMAFAVLFKGGGPDGLMLETLNPVKAFTALPENFEGTGVGAGAAGIGLLFAFWSWVGFEATAIFGEESKDPKKIVPRATMIAVVGIGVFYTFITWMAIAGNGAAAAVSLSASATPFELLYTPMATFVGAWGVTGFQFFVVGGSFACALAIHNSATRYLFAFGRDGLLPKAMGRSHPKYQSPYFASTTQTVITLVFIVGAYITGVDPYMGLYTVGAIFATVCLLSAQTLTAVACVWYFHVKKMHPETANVFRTILAPIIGGAGMLYVVYLVLLNIDFATGGQGDLPIVQVLPWLVLGVMVVPTVLALWWKSAKPHLYDRIGSSVFTHSD
jgi:amino acid transporter